jgi:hypothetical protein
MGHRGAAPEEGSGSSYLLAVISGGFGQPPNADCYCWFGVQANISQTYMVWWETPSECDLQGCGDPRTPVLPQMGWEVASHDFMMHTYRCTDATHCHDILNKNSLSEYE